MLKSYMNLFFFTSKYWFYNVLKVTYFSNVSWAFKTFQSFLLYCSPSNFGVIVTVKLHFHLRFKSIFLQLSFSLACNSLVFLATNNFDLFFFFNSYKGFPYLVFKLFVYYMAHFQMSMQCIYCEQDSTTFFNCILWVWSKSTFMKFQITRELLVQRWVWS